MESIEVKEVGELPNLEEGHIFNTPEFQSLKLGLKKNFVLYDDKIPISRICFSLEGKIAISGAHATFGSLDSQRSLGIEVAIYFLKEVLDRLQKDGVEKIIIKHWPLCYNDMSINDVYKSLGFKIIFSEINQHLIISDSPFVERIKNNERKKLNQSIKKDYKFKSLPFASLPSVYDLIKDTRDRKRYPVSMSFSELSTTIRRLPDKYLLFGLFDSEILIAAAVSIKVSKNILYNFYHGDALEYRSNSPLVLLVKKIYEYCQDEDINILDFGLSSENGILNEGLFAFKKNLGSETSKKITYQLNYE